MNVAFFIAWRYVFSKKKQFIHIISLVSLLGVAFGTMALVIALSVFNGLEDILKTNVFNAFDAELKVVLKQGKSFDRESLDSKKIKKIPGVTSVVEIIEDNALISYNGVQNIIIIKGVGKGFIKNNPIKNYIDGEFILQKNDQYFLILGKGIQNHLEMFDNQDQKVQIFYPKITTNLISIQPDDYYNTKDVWVSGFFSIEKQYDDNYVIAPIQFVRELMDYQNKITALEISIQQKTDIPIIKKKVQEIVGKQFQVLDEEEQHSDIFKILKTENFFVFLIFSFILFIASINIFFFLTMLAMEKKKDVEILYFIGADSFLIKKIFILVGIIIGFIGSSFGIFLGVIVCLLQEYFGIISMGISSSIIDAYPVKIEVMDSILIYSIIFLITFFISYRPASFISKIK